MPELPSYLRIREHSRLAALAARRLKVSQVAMVLGNTIYLHGVSRADFLANERWLRHELVHVAQFRRYGFWRFLGMYLLESARKGYLLNRFEQEARAAEDS